MVTFGPTVVGRRTSNETDQHATRCLRTDFPGGVGPFASLVMMIARDMEMQNREELDQNGWLIYQITAGLWNVLYGILSIFCPNPPLGNPGHGLRPFPEGALQFTALRAIRVLY